MTLVLISCMQCGFLYKSRSVQGTTPNNKIKMGHMKPLTKYHDRLFTITLPFLMALLTAMVLHGCATNPVTKKREFVLMSEEQELSIGRQMAPKIEKDYGVYPSKKLQDYIVSVGESIAKVSDRQNIFFHFTVLNSPIVNAFALPGGYIFITRGLLAHINSEAELAGVLAHEIGHVTARHAVRQYTKAASYQIGTGIASIFFPEIANYGQLADLVFVAISSGYSRQYETEADRIAVTYVIKAGYDPRAMFSLLQTLELLDRYKTGKKTYTSLFATHPETGKRIEDVEQTLNIPKHLTPDQLHINQMEYYRQIDGLVFGEDVQAGIIAGNKFQHPEFRIEVLFPQGWSIENTPDTVIAKDPDHDYKIELRVHYLTKRKSIEEAATSIAKRVGLKRISGSPQQINQLSAYVGMYEGRSRSLGFVMAQIGFFQQKDKIYYLTGIAKTEEFKEALPFFKKTIESFNELSLQEAQNIQPNRIRIYSVKKGDKLLSILKGLGRSPNEIKTVSLLNAWDPDKLPALEPEMVIKVLKNE